MKKKKYITSISYFVRHTPPTASDAEEMLKFVELLGQTKDTVLAAFYESVVFIIRCQDVVSMLDLQEKCNSGELAHGAEEIFMSDAFKEFNLEHVKVSVAVDLQEVVSKGNFYLHHFVTDKMHSVGIFFCLAPGY